MLSLKGKSHERLPRLVLWDKQDQVYEEGEKQVHRPASTWEEHTSHLGAKKTPMSQAKGYLKKGGGKSS